MFFYLGTGEVIALLVLRGHSADVHRAHLSGWTPAAAAPCRNQPIDGEEGFDGGGRPV